MVTLTVLGAEEAKATIQAVPAASKIAMKTFARLAGGTVLRFWKLYLSGPAGRTRLGVGTGRLRTSIRSERVAPATVIVGTDSSYARIHEFGGQTRPHVIRPRAGKVLAWFAAGPGGSGRARLASGLVVSGDMRFARFVNHPGSTIPPRPHRAPALRAAQPVLEALVAGAADEALRLAGAATAGITAGQKGRLAGLTEKGLTGRRTGPIRVTRGRG